MKLFAKITIVLFFVGQGAPECAPTGFSQGDDPPASPWKKASFRLEHQWKDKGGLPIIEATIDGKGPVKTLIDTGSRMVFITPNGLKRHGLKAEGNKVNVGLFKMGDQEFKGISLNLFTQSNVADDIDVVLGHAALAGSLLILDYEKKEVTFGRFPKNNEEKKFWEENYRSKGVVVPFAAPKERQEQPTGAFAINGKGPFPFLIDTGAATSVLSPAVVKANGVAGETFNITIGEKEIATAVYIEDGWGDNILGTTLLENFRQVIFNHRDRETIFIHKQEEKR